MASSNWSLLPNEILESIFLRVMVVLDDPNKDDVFECERVCKNWKLPAQRIAYSDVSLKCQSQLEILEREMVVHSSPAPFVKKLSLDLHMNKHQQESYLRTIANLFPNIEYLYTIKPDRAFFDTLVLLHSKESKFTKLKGFSRFSGNDNTLLEESYMKCALEFRNTLTTIHYSIARQPQDNQLKQLPNLPCLTELSITTSHADKNNTHLLYEFDSIIDNCTRLQSFKFHIVCKKEGVEAVIVNDDELKMIKPRPDIDNLFLKNYDALAEESIISYIIRKFPQLKLFQYYIDQYSDRRTSAATGTKLVTYLSGIPEYRINSLSVEEGAEGPILSQFFSALKSNDSKKKKKLTRLEIHYDINYEAVYNNGPSKNLVLLNLEKHSARESLQHNVCLTYQSEEEHDRIQPLQMLIEKNGEMIQGLTVIAYEPIHQRIVDSLLKATFNHCSANLTSLVLTNVDLGYVYPFFDGELLLSTLRQLEIRSCFIKSKHFLPSLSYLIPSLNILNIINCCRPQEITQDVNGISVDYFNYVDMPNTSFNTIYIESWFPEKFEWKGVYFKVSIIGTAASESITSGVGKMGSDDEYYFSVDFITEEYSLPQQPQSIKTRTKEEYLQAFNVDKKKYRCYSIKCKSVKKIILKEENQVAVEKCFV